jgi:hypothetical protein
MENRTSIEELMRQGSNSNSNDNSMVDSILEEIQNDKQSQAVNSMQQQQHQQQNQDNEARILQAQQMEAQRIMAQREAMEQQQRMELLQRQQQQDYMKQNEVDLTNNENGIPLLKEFLPTLIFLLIFVMLNITQINGFICESLSIENNNIFIFLKAFIGSILFFGLNKLLNNYV